MRRTLLAMMLSFAALEVSASTRGPVDSRNLIALEPAPSGFVATWVRENELVNPARATVYRAFVPADLSTPPQVETLVDGPRSEYGAFGGSSTMLVWARDRQVVASPVVDGRLRYPAGKLVIDGVNYQNAVCEQSRCAVIWRDFDNHLSGAFLDADANIATAFRLPDSGAIPAARIDAVGLFLVRSTATQTFATQVHFDGRIAFDTPLPPIPYGAAIDFDGGEHVIVWVDSPWGTQSPTPEVRAALVGPTGGTALIKSVVSFPGAALGPPVLAWDGAERLLAGTAGQSGVNSLWVSRLDGPLAPIDGAPRVIAEPVAFGMRPWVAASGDHFAVVWGDPLQMVVMDRFGVISNPVALEPQPLRKRVVRR